MIEINNIPVTEYPTILENNSCIVNDKITVVNCVINDNGSISGIATIKGTDETIKARFDNNKNIWVFGAKNIQKNNLIPLTERTKDERKAIYIKSQESRQANKEKKRNINELAKAMLEQSLKEDQITEILGTSTSMLLDDSVASVMLAKMIQTAMQGSFKAFETVRDTAGYRPKDVHEVQADIMTDSDRALIDKLNARIG